MTFLPAPAGAGVGFLRADVPDSSRVGAHVGRVAAPPAGVPQRNTTLRAGAAELVTVEHVLSAIEGLGITDITVEVRGPEVPIFDGSAAPLVRALWEASLRFGGASIEPLRIGRETTVTGPHGSRITARPRSGSGCLYRYELDYGPGAPIAPHTASYDSASGTYAKDVAPARTFCTLAEAEAMKKAGLFAHLSARDMLVIGPDGPVDNAYRFADEPARHKLLDLIGDLSLVGRPIQGEIVAYRSGHALNHQMAAALIAGD